MFILLQCLAKLRLVVFSRCVGTPPCLSASITKGNNSCDFLFAEMMKLFQKIGLLGVKILFLIVDLNLDKQHNRYNRVVAPETVLIHLNHEELKILLCGNRCTYTCTQRRQQNWLL